VNVGGDQTLCHSDRAASFRMAGPSSDAENGGGTKMQQPRSSGIWVVRAVWLGCWAMVTLLLLVPDPSVLVGLRRTPPWGNATLAHFGAFCLLSLLTRASRLPLSLPATLAVLVSYGAVVEWLQGLVPHRTVEFRDFAANVLGIAAGAATYAAAGWHRRRRAKKIQ